MAVSFLCSVLESVLMSTSLSYINLREEEGYAPAKLMSAYKEDTGRPLAAILSLNTIANTIGAAGVGMQATAVFGSSEGWVFIILPAHCSHTTSGMIAKYPASTISPIPASCKRPVISSQSRLKRVGTPAPAARPNAPHALFATTKATR